jgi:hypothetical protein
MVRVGRIPQHRLAQILTQDSPGTPIVYVSSIEGNLQQSVEERS